MIVYCLQHSYELDNGYDETKILGVFSSKQKTEKSSGRLQKII